MSRIDDAIREISGLRAKSDPDIRISEGTAGGATQITGFKRISLRTLHAIAASYGYDTSVPIHKNTTHIIIELINKIAYTAKPVQLTEPLTECLEHHLNTPVKELTRGGACTQFTITSNQHINSTLIADLLATSNVIDIWAFHNKYTILIAPEPSHTSALTHLRQHKPELFSPQHCRSIADTRGTYKFKKTRGKKHKFAL